MRRFAVLLEAYREYLRDVFDMPALLEILRSIGNRTLRVHTVDARTPSPFASALLFSYVANYVYDGDAPLAERRAQALFNRSGAVARVAGRCRSAGAAGPGGDRKYRRTTAVSCRYMAGTERRRRARSSAAAWRSDKDGAGEALYGCECYGKRVDKLIRARRVLEVQIAGERRCIAVEDAARYRDALGVPLPPGRADSLSQCGAGGDKPILIRRYARTHGPFTTVECAARFALPDTQTVAHSTGTGASWTRVMEGGFRPGGVHREWW